MPTGYTADLYDGPEEFDKFVLKCARAFGALIEMRDDPLDKPIPDVVEPGLYHLEQLNRAVERRAKVMAMTQAQIVAATEEAAKRLTEESHRSYEAELPRYQRFIEMRERVRAWTSPTPNHENLKKFMLEQLEHDCRKPDEPKVYEPDTPEQWLKDQLEHCEYNVEYHSKHYDEDVKRAKERTEWVQALKQSVGALS